MKQNGLKQLLLIALAIIVWFGLILQFVLIFDNMKVSVAETIFRFFCYFTILSNFLVALTITFQLISTENKLAIHFRKQSTLAAVAVYIVVVGIVYNIALRGLIELNGMHILANELLHVVTPVLYLLWWVLYAGKNQLQWKNAIVWLRYPFFYLIAVMIIGAVLPSRFYPYPFLDAYNHGYNKVAISAVVILILFLVLSFAIIALARFLSKKKLQNVI